MPRFVRKPIYTIRDLANLLNEFERERPTAERTTWNRWRVRTLLKNRGILPASAGRGSKATVSYEQLVEIRHSMQLIDAEDDALRASA